MCLLKEKKNFTQAYSQLKKINMLNKFRVYIKRMAPTEKSLPRKNLSEIFWSWLGSFLAIYIIGTLNISIGLSNVDSFFLVGSFGAGAVLLYASPQLGFSQPRNLLGGQVFSALVGVTVYTYFPFDISLLAPLAVSLAIVVMHLTRTMHPPGGATALIAVIGSSKVHELGYLFVIFPILSSTLVMLIIALIINNISKNPNRHYPRYWI